MINILEYKMVFMVFCEIKTPRKIILLTFIAHCNSIHSAASSSGAHGQLGETIQDHIKNLLRHSLLNYWVIKHIKLGLQQSAPHKVNKQ